jgi:hypothetical protein
MGVIAITYRSGALTCNQRLPKDTIASVSTGTCNMRQSEDVPLWESVTQPFANALDFAFGCHHRKLSRVFTINNHTYKVCCDCGATFNYSLDTMSVRHPRRLLSALRRLQSQPRRLLRGATRGI